MNNFDSIIEEAGIMSGLKSVGSSLASGLEAAGSAIGSVKSAVTPIVDVAKKAYSSPSLKDLGNLFDEKKYELKYVTYDTAVKSIKDLKEPTKVSTTGEVSTANVFSPTVVIMDNVYGFSGLKGQVINFEKPYSLDFRLFINQVQQVVNQDQSEDNNIDIDSFIFQTRPKRFWVKVSSTNPSMTVGESFDSTLNYGYSMINEAKGLVPPNEVGYATWFIFESDRPEFRQKFKITLANQKPDPSLGKAFRLDDMSGKPTGLMQVGQDTLYPKWYFLNDLMKYKEKEDKKDQTPTGVNLPSSYSGDRKI
jgi:hypothetical protein